MSWIKATVSFIHAVRHPDEIALEVETELHFHIEMRRQANIEEGMTPDEAQRAAVKSFGDLERVKHSCCEIRRSLPFDSMPLRMGFHIVIAGFAGAVAVWAVNMPHDNFTGVLRQLIPIVVLTYLFVVVRRARSRRRFVGKNENGIFVGESERFQVNKSLTSDMSRPSSAIITAHDEQGRTPLERVFKS